jgi:hypothetical protein
MNTGRVLMVMKKRRHSDARVLCVCHVDRQQLVESVGEGFPAFFVAQEGGKVGAFTHRFEYMFTLNSVPDFDATTDTCTEITCMGTSNSVLLLGLGDGRIIMYDLDGSDDAKVVKNTASIARSVPLVIEVPNHDAALGICCSCCGVAVVRSRLSVKLVDVKKGRKVIVTMQVSRDKSIVAASYKQMQRVGVVLLLQVTSDA